MVSLSYDNNLIRFDGKSYAIGNTDSQTNRDTSTKITQNKNTAHDSAKYINTPNRLSLYTSKSQKFDANLTAMDALKEKLKHFIFDHQKTVLRMEQEILMLRQENENLKQNQA